jgi:hypothetical protein
VAEAFWEIHNIRDLLGAFPTMFPNVSNRWVYEDDKSARKMCQEKDKNQSFAHHVSLKLLSGIFLNIFSRKLLGFIEVH